MTRASQWEVLRRCLRLIVRLEQGPASRDELLGLAYDEEPNPVNLKRFENDMKRLRENIGVEVIYDYPDKVYSLGQAGEIALLDLPDNALRGLAFLADTFEPGAPHHEDVHDLLETISTLLSHKRRAILGRVRTAFNVDLKPHDQDVLDRATWNKLERAFRERRVVLFEYVSPEDADGMPRQHEVEVRRLYFDTIRFHYYLKGYCRWITWPGGSSSPQSYLQYRIGRIKPGTVQLLPECFPETEPRTPMFEVSYRLAPRIARLGVSHHFEETTTYIEADGSVVVNARTDNVFHAVRTLLYYGANCCVLGGAEVLSEMRQIVQDMSTLY